MDSDAVPLDKIDISVSPPVYTEGIYLAKGQKISFTGQLTKTYKANIQCFLYSLEEHSTKEVVIGKNGMVFSGTAVPWHNGKYQLWVFGDGKDITDQVKISYGAHKSFVVTGSKVMIPF